MDSQQVDKRQQRRQAAREEIRALLRDIGRGIADMVLAALPWLIRGLCVLAMVASAAYSAFQTWQLFGSDLVSALPAIIPILPVALALSGDFGWGGLLFSAAGSLAVYLGLAALSPIWRSVAIAGALALVIFYFVFLSRGWATSTNGKELRQDESTYARQETENDSGRYAGRNVRAGAAGLHDTGRHRHSKGNASAGAMASASRIRRRLTNRNTSGFAGL